MVEGKETQSQRVTLEKLLRMKRAERPDPEFWDGFERELRQKQLSALVQAQPWYHRAGRFVGLLARRSAPVTAAAAAIVAGYFAVNGPTAVVQGPANERFETVRVSPAATTVAAIETLPELVIQPDVAWSEPVAVAPQPVRAEARYVMEVMSKELQPARYVTLSSPKTMLASGSRDGTYVVNALSSQNAFHPSASRGVAKF